MGFQELPAAACTGTRCMGASQGLWWCAQTALSCCCWWWRHVQRRMCTQQQRGQVLCRTQVLLNMCPDNWEGGGGEARTRA